MPDQQPEITSEQLVARYIELRDEQEQLKAKYDAELAESKDFQEAIMDELVHRMQTAGSKTLKTSAGSIISKLTSKFVATDTGEFIRFIRETGQVELLQSRISTSAIKEYVDSGNEVPPGIGIEEAITYTVRKP